MPSGRVPIPNKQRHSGSLENYAATPQNEPTQQLARISKVDLAVCAAVIKTFLQLPADLRPRKKIETHQINDQPAARSELAGIFLRLGFEGEGDKIVLWPSRLGASNQDCDTKSGRDGTKKGAEEQFSEEADIIEKWK